jgi:hypothetical protein
MKARKTTKVGLAISPCVYPMAVCRKGCGTIFYVDAKPESTGEEIFELEDIHCGLHPSESSVIGLV